MKKFVSAAITTILALSLTACGSGSTASTSASSSAASSASGKAQNIVIGISPDYPPFDDLTTSGELTGFDYDMGEWLLATGCIVKRADPAPHIKPGMVYPIPGFQVLQV